MKTALSAVFKVTCGRVLCVHGDVSVHTLFDRSTAVNDVEMVMTDVIIREPEIGLTQRSSKVTIAVRRAS